MKFILGLVCIVLPLFLISCGETEVLPLYGAPTKLQQGESPLDAICRIQAEFRALPKPLMEGQNFISGWTTRSLGAASVKHRGYYRIHLSPEGLAFLQRHSRLEVVASLSPLFADPLVGGEAAVLLAGTPSGSKSEQGAYTRNIANAIHETHYKSPKRSGDWFTNVVQRYGIARNLYGLTNTTESVHKRYDPAFESSLEKQIVEFLLAHSRSPLKLFASGHPRVPQPHDVARVEQWIAVQNVPALAPKAQTFIESNRGLFASMALLPLMPFPQSTLKGNELYMMWLVGMESEHWPAMLRLNNGLKVQKERIAKFRQGVSIKLAKTCEPKS